MAHVIFYEKPGCGGNRRQKAILAEAGHTVEPRDLLTAPWTPETLRVFFGALPVSQWFNRAAPAVKEGRVNPDAVDESAALALMLEQPILIRRPLMQVGEEKMAGFEADRVEAWIGLGESAAPGDKLEGCARPDMPPCPTPATPIGTK